MDEGSIKKTKNKEFPWLCKIVLERYFETREDAEHYADCIYSYDVELEG